MEYSCLQSLETGFMMVSTLYKGHYRSYKPCTCPQCSSSLKPFIQTLVFSLEFVGLHCSQTTFSSDHYHALLQFGVPLAYTTKFLQLQRHLREWQMTQPSFSGCSLLDLYMVNEKKQIVFQFKLDNAYTYSHWQ